MCVYVPYRFSLLLPQLCAAARMGFSRPVSLEGSNSSHNAVQMSLSLSLFALTTEPNSHKHSLPQYWKIMRYRHRIFLRGSQNLKALSLSLLSFCSFWSLPLSWWQKHTQEEWLCYLEITAAHSISISLLFSFLLSILTCIFV